MRQRARNRLVGIIALGVGVGLGIGCGNDLIKDPTGPDEEPTEEPTGALEISAVTTGYDLDSDGYTVSVDGGPERYSLRQHTILRLDGISADSHEVRLHDVDANCSLPENGGANPRTVAVQDGETTTVSFHVRCELVTELVLVSGQDQRGTAGQELDEPLVVQVIGSTGAGLADIEVTWHIEDGDGALQSRFDENGEAVTEVATSTGADGITQVSFLPTSFGLAQIVAEVMEGYSPGLAEFTIDATDLGATLTLVSGNDQPTATAGRTLARPFVVQVTNGLGDPAPNVLVTWSMAFGEGAFAWDELGEPLTETTTYTDANGLADVTLTPTWFGPTVVRADAGALLSSVTFATDATDYGATVTIVSGDGQEGKTKVPLAEPLVVRVTDGAGNPVPNVGVHWEGSGRFDDRPEGWGSYSDADGLVARTFSPRSLGAVGVTAELDALHQPSVTFHADVTVLVISYEAYDGRPSFYGLGYDEGCWYDNCSASDHIPFGTTVEWVNYTSDPLLLVTTSTPPGGGTFRSPVLGLNERFQFVPDVTGTWEYTGEVEGSHVAVGKVTVW